MGDKKSPIAPLAFPEPPTAAARLVIKVGPAQLAEGTVPPDQARHLITTFGILGCIFSGIGGAVLTLHVAAAPSALAFAELAIALAGAALIALAGRVAVRRRDDHSRTGAGPSWHPGSPGHGQPGSNDQPDGMAWLKPAVRPPEPPRTSR